MITEVQDECINSFNSSRVDRIVFGVEVIVNNCRDQDVNHLGQVVLHQVDYFL